MTKKQWRGKYSPDVSPNYSEPPPPNCLTYEDVQRDSYFRRVDEGALIFPLEIKVGDVVTFEHENDPNIVENLVVEEIVDQWDKGKKIRCARCGGSFYDVRFLTLQKR